MRIVTSFLFLLFLATLLPASTIEELTQDALISKRSYPITGTFGAHDFADAQPAFDWAFTLTNGTSYQLQGNPPNEGDVFGWKAVSIEPPVPAWYMFSLGEDVDGDGSKKFDWVLLSTDINKKAAYKLKGETPTGTFDYSDKLDIDYTIQNNQVTISSTTAQEKVTSEFSKTQTLSSSKMTHIEVAGEGDDLLTITLQKLPFGYAQDINVTFTLRYTQNSTLPEIEVATEIAFDTVVTFTFYSSNLSAKNYVLIYHGATQDYFVPFVKTGSRYTATLLHFSSYGFKEQPSLSVLKNSIESELAQLGSYRGSDGIYGLNDNLIGDVVTKINLLEESDADLAHGYMNKIIDIIEVAVDRWLLKMKQSTVPYWDGYCMHKNFSDYLTQLAQTAMYMELIGAKSIDDDVHHLIDTHMQAAYEEWKGITPPKACATSSMRRYLRCAVKFMIDAEIAGVNISHKEQNQILIDYVEGNILYVLANASCPELACVKYYLSMAQSGELENMGIGHDYTQELKDKVDEIEKKVEEERCSPQNWYLKIDFTQPDITYGSVTYKNFTLDCAQPISSDPFYGDVCTYLSSSSYTDVRTSKQIEVSYSGDLSDPELEPLFIYEGGISFNAQSTSEIGAMAFAQIGSFVFEGEFAHAPLEHCFGNFQTDTLSNIKAGKPSQWTSEHPQNFAYCTFTLKPCKDEACDTY
jgi:hypothetical protein